MNRTAWIALAAVLVLHPAVHAQDPDSIKGAVGAPADSTKGTVGGDMNFGMIDGDLFATVNLGFAMDLGKIGFGVQVPLRLRLHDADPQDQESAGVFRKEDWDEFSDYLKIIRYFRYGRKGELVHVVVGDLPGATVGHGTIVNRYHNNIDLDHYLLGVVADVNTDYGGVETVFNSVAPPTLIGVRGYVRPWSFIDTESYANNLAVGVSVVTDYAAPYELGVFEEGDKYPQVERERAATIVGGDIEFRVLDTSWLTLTPYTDLNGILDAGMGYHLGLLSVFHVPLISLDIQTRLEYRYFQGDYIPAYFNSYYEIQKFGYPFKDESGAFGGGEQSLPKRRVLDELGGRGALNGYYAELVFSVLELFTVGASYDDYDGPYNSNLRVYLEVPALEFFQFGAYYYRHSFEGASEAFAFDDKSLFLAEARVPIGAGFHVKGQYWRVWQLDNDPDSETAGEYIPVDDWSLGVGFAYSF